MDYNNLFSKAVSRSKASAIRELLKVISRPEIISFAGGLPDPSLFPQAAIKDIFNTLLEKNAKEALQYGATEGQDRLKQELIRMLRDTERITVAPEQILVVSASQQALDMSARMFVDPGDSIITACPTYLGALQAFQVVL